MGFNVLRLFYERHVCARELYALAREREVYPPRRELTRLRCINSLAPAVHAVAAREELRVARAHRLGLDAHALGPAAARRRHRIDGRVARAYDRDRAPYGHALPTPRLDPLDEVERVVDAL